MQANAAIAVRAYPGPGRECAPPPVPPVAILEAEHLMVFGMAKLHLKPSRSADIALHLSGVRQKSPSGIAERSEIDTLFKYL